MSETSLFYTEKSGKVVAIPFRQQPIIKVSLEPAIYTGKWFDNRARRIDAFIQDIDLSHAVNISTTPSLGTDIFVYILSETLAPVTISGLGYIAANCSRGRGDGFADVLRFYNQNNIAYSGRPCKLLIHNTVFRVQLLSCKLKFASKYDGFFSFTMTFQGFQSRGIL